MEKLIFFYAIFCYMYAYLYTYEYIFAMLIDKKNKKVKKSDFPRSPRASRANHSRKHSSNLIKLICYFASASESQKFTRPSKAPRADFFKAEFSKALGPTYSIRHFHSIKSLS